MCYREKKEKKEVRKFRTICFILFGLALIIGLLVAQESKGKIIGTVTDDEGLPLPGVTVEATSPKMVGIATAITTESGVYRLLALPPGTYTITFALEGFNSVIRENIVLSLEQTLMVDILMEIGTIAEAITVTGEVPLIDVKSTTRGMTMAKEMFEMLPRGRNFDTLVSAIPGVDNEIHLGGISIDGASGSENVFYVDGVNITHMYTGLGTHSAAFEFVEEVQVKASGYQAEFGGAVGGVINVITRSGGNEYHGEIIGYYSGSMLTTKERDTLRLSPFDSTIAEYVNYEDDLGKDKVHRYEVGFSLGGYIIKDKLWFFGSFLPVFEKTTRHVKWIPEGIAPASDISQKYTFWNGSFKLSAQPTKGLRLSGSFVNNFSKFRGDLPPRDGAGDPGKAYDATGFDYPNWTGSLSADYVVGNNFLISVRGGYFHTNINNQLVQPTGVMYDFDKAPPEGQETTNTMFPEIPPEYIKPLGWSNMSSSDLLLLNKEIRDRASFNLDLTYYMNLAGEHSWKAGIQWVRIEEDIDNTAAFEWVRIGWDTSFTWQATGEDFRGTYGHYTVLGGAAGPYGSFWHLKTPRWAIYLQDSWTPDFLDNKLTINLGIRAEREEIPSFSTLPEYQYSPIVWDFKDKIAPRFGFIYDVFGDSTTKIFGSYSFHYDVMKLKAAQSYFGGFKKWHDYYTLEDWDFYDIGNGNYPGTYITTYNMRTPAFDLTDPNMKPMSEREITFGGEHKLREDLSASIRVVNKHLRYAVEDISVFTLEGEIYYLANPGYGWSQPESQGGRFDDKYPPVVKARREYWAVNFSLDKRFSNNWMGGFSYTWSRLWGNYSGLASSDEWGRTAPNFERYFDGWFLNYDKNVNNVLGLLQTDRPHRFKFYGSYVFDFGLTAGLVAYAMSGTPVSREFRVEPGYYPDGRFTDGRTPFLFYANAYVEYNLKVTDKYRIQLNLNVDNFLNTNTAQRIFQTMNYTSVSIPEDSLINGYDYNDFAWDPDPRFLKQMEFFRPLQARIGLKIIF